MSNKITYGLEQVHVAFMGGELTWEPPVHIPGAIRFTPTPEGENVKIYADNQPYFTWVTNNGYTAELEMAAVPDDIKARMLGWEIDENGMLVEIADAQQEPFALLGQIQGDARNRRFIYYNCKASRPGKEHQTRGETFTPSTDVLSLEILPITVNGLSIVRGVMELTETNKAKYDGFFQAVLLPEWGAGEGEEV